MIRRTAGVLIPVLALACLTGWQKGAAAVEIEANGIVHASGAEARVMWFDADANFARLSSREAWRETMRHCHEANINTVVIDVKDITGRVFYDSAIAPHRTELNGAPLDESFDFLKVACEEGHAQHLAVYASINVFSEGRRREGGPVFDHPDWEAVIYDVEPWVSIPGGDAYPASAVNARPLEGRLAIFSDPASAGKLQGGETAVAVDRASGKVTDVSPHPPAVAHGEYLLLGTGAAGDWLKQMTQGSEVRLSAKPRFIPARLAAEMHNAIFVNPANRDARDYELRVIGEMAAKYDLDGIVLDRMRYSGLNSDFSDASRHAFETWLGAKVERWPEDILTFGPLPSDDPVRGKLFAKWIEWRAENIRSFLQEARTVVRTLRPGMETAVYVGSWYWSYFDLGPNWASDRFKPGADWASPDYHRTGFAPLADWITTGCYYATATRAEARAAGIGDGGTVEAAAEGSVNVIGNATFTYAGLYLLDYRDNPDAFLKAVKVCQSETQGVMLFDLVYVEEFGWWDVLKRAFPSPAPIPHKDPALRKALGEAYQRSY